MISCEVANQVIERKLYGQVNIASLKPGPKPCAKMIFIIFHFTNFGFHNGWRLILNG